MKINTLIELAERLTLTKSDRLSERVSGRVAYIVSNSPTFSNKGYAIRTKVVAESLLDEGFEVLTFNRPGRPWCIKNTPNCEYEEIENGVRYFHLPYDKKDYDLEYLVDLSIEIFSVYKPEIVLAASNWENALPAMIAAKILEIPFFYEKRGFWELSKLEKNDQYFYSEEYVKEILLEKYLCNNALKVFTLSNSMKIELTKQEVVRPIVVTRNFYPLKNIKLHEDTENLKINLGFSKEDIIFGYFGSINPYEDIELLIKSIDLIYNEKQNIKLLIISNDDIEFLENALFIKRINGVKNSEISKYYSIVDTVVLPRKKSKLSAMVPAFKFSEAIAFGKKVIAPDLEVYREYSDGYNGAFLYDESVKNSLSEKIKLSIEYKENIINERRSDKYIESFTKSFLPFVKLNNISENSVIENERTFFKWNTLKIYHSTDKIRFTVKLRKICRLKSFLIRFELFDDSYNSVTSDDLYLSEAYGYFRYLSFSKKENVYESVFDLNVNDNIKYIGFSFVSLDTSIEDIFSLDIKHIERKVSNVSEESEDDNIYFQLENLDKINNIQNSSFVICADISPNVLDGSSIWLTSIVNSLIENYSVTVVLKDNIINNKVVSNIDLKNKNLCVIEPNDLKLNGPQSPESLANILSLLYPHTFKLQAVITRGVNLAYEVQKYKEFKDVLCPYITDFYEITASGFEFNKDKVKLLPEIVLNSKSVLYQTKYIQDKVTEVVGFDHRGILVPPSIPDNMDIPVTIENEKSDFNVLKIGYAGKIQPRWGVEELITQVSDLNKDGYNIELHIATGKIYSKKSDESNFVDNMKKLLTKKFIVLHEDLDRKAAMEMISNMDLVWCYRDPVLEDSTLELSTKLIETAYLKKPCVAYCSEINKAFLGNDYPYLIQRASDITVLVNKHLSEKALHQDKINKVYEKVSKQHVFSFISSQLSQLIVLSGLEELASSKILFAGHDFKFIYRYINYLRANGVQVALDFWYWGKEKNIKISNIYSEWSSHVFCEWGLANSVWYSENIAPNKKLIVRYHAQEVREKAKKFSLALNQSNVSDFIFVSPVIESKAKELFNIRKSEFVPNFVSDSLLFDADRSINASNIRIGILGIVPTSKRFDRAIDLVASLIASGLNVKLSVKGHRPEQLEFMKAQGRHKELKFYRSLYERIESDINLKNSVEFVPWGNDVDLWYSDIDFILSCSDHESFHYALADGVVAGCVPIVWNWKGAEEVFDPEWVVTDLRQASDRVYSVLRLDKQQLSATRVRNRDLVLSRYSEEVVFPKLTNFLK